MFATGDYLYYASEGVCFVADIRTSPLKGMPEDKLYYVLRPCRSESTVYVPVDNDAVFLRKLMTTDEANQFLDAIPNLQTFDEPNAKALKTRYIEAMRMHTPTEWVRVIKTVRKRSEKLASVSKTQKLSETERSYAVDAKRHLFSELSLALDVPYGEVEQFIRRHIEENLESNPA